MSDIVYLLAIFIILIFSQHGYSSNTMTLNAARNIAKTEITSAEDRERLSIAAGLLADYEFSARKLIDSLKEDNMNHEHITKQANTLLRLSETLIDSTRFRLPQCDRYLVKALTLKNHLKTISYQDLETNYHHDGALPKAPKECYHTKDLFVHPATVIVLTRDNPELKEITKASISAEITEVITHTEIVRQLVIY